MKKTVTTTAKKVPTSMEPTKMNAKNATAPSRETNVTPLVSNSSRVRYSTMATASLSTDSPKTRE